MPDPTRRVENWTAKVTPERTVTDLNAQLGSMSENAKATFVSITVMEQQVRALLNGSGVPTIQYPFYLNFGRQLWSKIRKGMAGESLATEGAVLVAYWVAQGLTQSVLEAIRSQVFNVAAPIAP